MAPKKPSSGLSVGLNKGHIVTPKDMAPRPSDRKGVRVPSFLSLRILYGSAYSTMNINLISMHFYPKKSKQLLYKSNNYL